MAVPRLWPDSEETHCRSHSNVVLLPRPEDARKNGILHAQWKLINANPIITFTLTEKNIVFRYPVGVRPV